MSDEVNKVIAAAAAEVSKTKGGQRALEATGDAVAAVAEFGSEVVQLLVGGPAAGIRRLREAMGLRIKDVPRERRQLAPATISAPATMQYLLLGDGEDVAVLREMIEMLLLASVDSETASRAHPAFVRIIADLTPTEAWLLESITRPHYAMSRVYRQAPQGSVEVGIRTTLGEGLGLQPDEKERCLWNLDRLGIVQISETTTSSEGEHDELVLQVDAEFPDDQHQIVGHSGSVRVTRLGQQFLDTCVRPRNA